METPAAFEQIIHSWDTASKATQLSGYSVCTIWGVVNKRIHLIDVVRARFEYPELRATALALARGQYRGHRRPDLILIEDKASGQSLIQDLKQENVRNIQAVEPEADKTTRMYTQTAVIANGHVMIPHEAPWLADYLQEMIAFPKGRYSDQVDSTSQALKWFNYQPDEPSLIVYCREDLARMRAEKGGVNDENRIVTMLFSGEPTTVHARSTDVITIDPDGLYRMKWCDAQDLLRNGGWSLVEEA